MALGCACVSAVRRRYSETITITWLYRGTDRVAWKALLVWAHGPQAIALVAGFLLSVGIVIALKRRPPQIHKRGTLVKDGAAAQRAGRRLQRRRPDILTLAGVALPPLDETKHFKLIGTTGTGKSTPIREFLAGPL